MVNHVETMTPTPEEKTRLSYVHVVFTVARNVPHVQ